MSSTRRLRSSRTERLRPTRSSSSFRRRRPTSSACEVSESELCASPSSQTELCEHTIGSATRARGQTTPFSGALESLAERAVPSWPHRKRHFHLLVFADLSTQARSGYGKL